MLALIGEILTFPLLLLELAVAAMVFSTEAFQRAATSADAQTAALTIAFLAGVSEMLGQSVILVVNRVALYRFIASLIFTGVTYLVTALIWTFSAILVAPLTRVGVIDLGDTLSIFAIVALAFAPRLLGVFSIAPYFGVAIGNLLEAWAMVLAIFGLRVALDLPLGAAVFCGGAGWLVGYLLRNFLGHALAKPLGKLRVFVSGSPLEHSPQHILEDIIQNIRGDSKP